jgi:hypothetical protein
MHRYKATAPFTEHAHKIISLLNRCVDLLGNDANDAANKKMPNEMGQKHAVLGVTEAHATAWGIAFDKMYAVVFGQRFRN